MSDCSLNFLCDPLLFSLSVSLWYYCEIYFTAVRGIYQHVFLICSGTLLRHTHVESYFFLSPLSMPVDFSLLMGFHMEISVGLGRCALLVYEAKDRNDYGVLYDTEKLFARVLFSRKRLEVSERETDKLIFFVWVM